MENVVKITGLAMTVTAIKMTVSMHLCARELRT